jgi:hypothetical protein
VRSDGSGGKYSGRSSATRPDNTRIERCQPIRSAITVAGILGYVCSSSRIRGSTASTTDPPGLRRHVGGPSAFNALRTVFRDTPQTRAITRTDNPSARCNLRISAQSSTDNTSLPSLARLEPGSKEVGQLSCSDTGSVSRAADTFHR